MRTQDLFQVPHRNYPQEVNVYVQGYMHIIRTLIDKGFPQRKIDAPVAWVKLSLAGTNLLDDRGHLNE